MVIRVDVLRSLEPPWDSVRIPEFSLYGDGRVIVPGQRDGALVVAREFSLDSAGTTALYRRAYAAGPDRSRDLTGRHVIDGWALVVTVATPDGPAVTTVANPDRDHPVQRFVDRLPHGRTDAQEYRPPGWLAVSTPPFGNGDLPRPWPFIPAAGGRCAHQAGLVRAGDRGRRRRGRRARRDAAHAMGPRRPRGRRDRRSAPSGLAGLRRDRRLTKA